MKIKKKKLKTLNNWTIGGKTVKSMQITSKKGKKEKKRKKEKEKSQKKSEKLIN